MRNALELRFLTQSADPPDGDICLILAKSGFARYSNFPSGVTLRKRLISAESGYGIRLYHTLYCERCTDILILFSTDALKYMDSVRHVELLTPNSTYVVTESVNVRHF